MKYYLDNLQSIEGLIGGHHSNNGSPTEDGNQDIALHIFDNIGIEHGFVLDIGAFSTKASNVIPIMKKYNIPGLLLDGANKYNDPEIIKTWITVENVDQLLQSLKCPKKLDYISLDIDNMDYWIIKSVLESGYLSNLLILEFNPLWSYNEAYTKKYSPAASKNDSWTAYSSNYGASLYAFVKLLSKFGYRLIHVMKQNLHGDPSSNNAFFIQERFDTENRFINQEEIIKQLFPVSFIESFKKQKTYDKFNVSTNDEVKEILKRDWFLEV
jgi:hypothetical protein